MRVAGRGEVYLAGLLRKLRFATATAVEGDEVIGAELLRRMAENGRKWG